METNSINSNNNNLIDNDLRMNSEANSNNILNPNSIKLEINYGLLQFFFFNLFFAMMIISLILTILKNPGELENKYVIYFNNFDNFNNFFNKKTKII